MKANEYQQLAARTLLSAPGFQITDDDLMLAWNMMGLVGEVGEFVEIITYPNFDNISPAKVAKEAGDVMWYIAAICTKQGKHLAEFQMHYAPIGLWQRFTFAEMGCRLMTPAAKAADLVKKGVFHQHGMNFSKLMDCLFDVYRTLTEICEGFDLDMSVVWQTNIEKLILRYPDGFKSQDSIHRTDVT
jgi:NTP pyrophosphatase (non-canonical NTP hydrolase)